ncbi:MAG: single-stranded DNA-binding protein [Alloprevotella sp.]|nr:single-stranded DNA-binding protein [Alloprevotella sp.]MDY6297646.1 single-stranded DNA-binding protein [Alloprevotella sp.]
MSLNKVMLIGNVGKEPVIRYIEGGVCTASLTLATSTPGYRLPNGTEVPERTEWHNVLLWRRLAEVVERYVHKGDKLYIEGELRTRNWTDKKGQTHYITEVWAKEMEMLTPRSARETTTAPQPPQETKQEGNAVDSRQEELPF